MRSLSTGTRTAIAIVGLLLARPASTMASEQEGLGSLSAVTRVCQSGALYLCDKYVAPPYTVTYKSAQVRINGYLYKNFCAHEDAIAKRIAAGVFGGFDLSFYLQQRSDSLRDNGVSQRETRKRVLALAGSLDNNRVDIEEGDEEKLYVRDLEENASYAVNIWSDAALAKSHAFPPPGIECMERLVSILQAGRPVFVLGKTRRGPASYPQNDSTFVALWNRSRGRDAKAIERDLEGFRDEYRRKGDAVHAGFCRDLLGCLRDEQGGRP